MSDKDEIIVGFDQMFDFTQYLLFNMVQYFFKIQSILNIHKYPYIYIRYLISCIFIV